MGKNPDATALPVAYDRLAAWCTAANDLCMTSTDPRVEEGARTAAQAKFIDTFMVAALIGELINAVGERKASRILGTIEESIEGGTAIVWVRGELDALKNASA